MANPEDLAGSVQIWQLDLAEAMEPADERWLRPEERQRAERYKAPQARRSFVLTRGYLRRLLGGYLAADPLGIDLVTNEYGKPRLAGTAENEGLVFSLSHSGEKAVLAFALDTALGVDVERLRRRRGLDGLAQHCLSDEEYHAWRRCPDDWQGFIRYWVCKEAFVKAIGRGIALGVSQVEVSGDFTAFERLPAGCGTPDQWRLSEWGEGEYRFALAYRGPERQLVFPRAGA